ncbi:iron chaperone [Leptospira santarosai]|uniref:iron chaperone n=1 Tax=Leptospira santarosai TaxID=28183 RepID=UPI0031FD11BF
MNSKKIGFKDIDDYISRFPEDVRKILEELRSAIRKAAPKAEEKISYQIPTFVFGGNLVYFAAYKKHIGFYPTSSGICPRALPPSGMCVKNVTVNNPA